MTQGTPRQHLLDAHTRIVFCAEPSVTGQQLAEALTLRVQLVLQHALRSARLQVLIEQDGPVIFETFPFPFRGCLNQVLAAP